MFTVHRVFGIALAVAVALWPAVGRGAGEAAPLPSARAFDALADAVAKNDFNRIARTGATLRPAITAVEAREGVVIQERLAAAAAARDAVAVTNAAAYLFLSSVDVRLRSLVLPKRGSDDDRDAVRAAVLDYELVGEAVQRDAFALDGRIRQGLSKLSILLGNAGALDDTGKIRSARDALVGAVAAALARFDDPGERLVLIVAAASRLEQVDPIEIRRLFLGEKVFAAGIALVALDLPEASPVRVVFSLRHLNKTPEALKPYWVQNIFSGRAVPPMVLTTEDQVRRHVADHDGAVGYVRRRFLDPSVKPVRLSEADP